MRKAERPKAKGKQGQKITKIPEGVKRLKPKVAKPRKSHENSFKPKPKVRVRETVNPAFIPKMATPKGLSPLAEFMRDVKPKDAWDKLHEFQDMCEHVYDIDLGERVIDGARCKMLKCSLCNVHTQKKIH